MNNHRFRSISLVALALGAFSSMPSSQAQQTLPPIPLKEAKIIIEHNATDRDTGFQGFIDSDGWRELTVTGPEGEVLNFEGEGKLRRLGLTELFFETVEPENADVPIRDLLKILPEGNYRIAGPAFDGLGRPRLTVGTALLTHNIPQGPVLLAPVKGATVPINDLIVKWQPVTQTIFHKPVKIISYQLIVEKDEPPHPNMIGKRGLSMYLPPTTTRIELPDGFLERRTPYKWEVLAIEESGNQTLSSSEFETR